MKMKLQTGFYIIILIDNLPHITLKTSEFMGFQSWIDDYGKPRYCIEIYTSNNKIVCGYEKR